MSRAGLLILGAALVAVAVGAAAAVGWLLGSGDGRDDLGLVMIPRSAAGVAPFAPSVATPSSMGDGSEQGASRPVGDYSADQFQSTESSGARPGLYGGTRNRSSCDRDKLVLYLEANPDKARAWKAALGIDNDVDDYLRTLTPVVLRRDTRATNHGFEHGEAFGFQALLQAGTAVLVDGTGVPRVLCACGNPLARAASLEGDGVTGRAWRGFSPNRVSSVRPAPRTQRRFVLTDSDDHTRFVRRVGTVDDSDGPDPRLTRTCTNQELGFRISYPSGWYEALRDSPKWSPYDTDPGYERYRCTFFSDQLDGIPQPNTEGTAPIRLNVGELNSEGVANPLLSPPANARTLTLGGRRAQQWQSVDQNNSALQTDVLSVAVGNDRVVQAYVAHAGSPAKRALYLSTARSILATVEGKEAQTPQPREPSPPSSGTPGSSEPNPYGRSHQYCGAFRDRGGLRIRVYASHLPCSEAIQIQREYWLGPRRRKVIVNGGHGAGGSIRLKRYPGWRCTSGSGGGGCRKGSSEASYQN